MRTLHRLYNVVWLLALAVASLQVIFLPVPQRKYALGVALALIAFRYVVRVPTARQ